MDCKDIDDLIGSIRRKVVKGSKPTRQGRLRACLRMLDGKGSDMGKSVFEQAVESFRGTPSRSTLGDAIARFRGLSEANTPAPAVNRETPGGKQKSSKSKFDTGETPKAKNYDGKAASVKADSEPKKGSEGTGADGREEIDLRTEDVYNSREDEDVLFAEQMLTDRVGYMPSMGEHLAEQEAASRRKMLAEQDPDRADLAFFEQNMAAPAVSRETPGGKQTSAKSRFRQGYKGPGKKYDGKAASIPADKEPMDAAANSTDGVEGEGYGADGREEVDTRGE